MIKIRAYAKQPTEGMYNYPLGYVNRSHIHITCATLARNENGGQISKEAAKDLLTDALDTGALVVIKFLEDDVEIELNRE